ncbi:MAG: IPT/TIG domain-containing protein [Candidatus Falkowbacteria bacterium]
MPKKLTQFLILIVFAISLALPVKAQLLDAWSDPFSESQVGFNAIASVGFGRKDPRVIAAGIVQIVMGFLGVLAILLIIYAGFLWMTAGGEAGKIETAKKILKNGVIGLLIVLSAFAIATYILRVLVPVTGGEQQTLQSTSCADGAKRSCGCGGIQSCGGSSWGPCVGSDCLANVSRHYCDSNTLTPVCDADSSLCEPNQYCDEKDCRCSVGGGVGDPCDSDLTNQTCEPNNARCGQYLTCDPNTCFCQGGPAIDALSPMGGFCDGNNAKPCLADDDCAGLNPATCNHQDPNGAVGNLLTIRGRYFDNYQAGQSKVFIGAVEAPLADSVNTHCNQGWTDTQIVVAIPAGAVSGLVRVENANGADTTADERGPKVKDFQVNNLQRPGLCQLSKVEGIYQDNLTYYGVNLGSVSGFFGNYVQSIPGLESVFTASDAGTLKVPQFEARETTTFVLAASKAASNFLGFNKLKDASSGPQVVSFEPSSGSAGTYVTIRGTGFGARRSNSSVMFDSIEADTSFPIVCAESVWVDNQIVVKVPTGIKDGDYQLGVEVGSQLGLSTQKFKVDSTKPLSAGLCKIEPSLVRTNDQVTLYGENFGRLDKNSHIKFNVDASQSFGAKICWGGSDDGKACTADRDCDSRQCLDALASWGPDAKASAPRPDKAVTKVPLAAITGPVTLYKNSPAVLSNSLNLTIGECLSDSQCGTGNYCCQQGSPLAGTCQDKPDKCFGANANCVYEWEFNTGGTGSCPDSKKNLCQDGTCCASTCVSKDLSGKTTCPDNGSCADVASNQCLGANTCPNAPGKCSSNNSIKIVGSTCDCALLGMAKAAYDSTLNRCVDQTAGQATGCDLPKNFSSGKESLSGYCAVYQGKSRWHLRTPSICPDGFTKATDNPRENVCVDINSSCQLCSGNLKCLEKDGKGVCASQYNVCPGQLTCQQGVCASQESVCECCCDKTQNSPQPGGANPGCCAPLTCANSCGAGGDFGLCSGCASVGITQEEHDNACNCSSTFGKYCDTSIGANGACKDCSQIGDPAECTKHDACCVDFKHGNACVSVTETKVFENNLAYCGYYKCGDSCAQPGKEGAYTKAAACTGDCAASCDADADLPGCQKDNNKCPADKPFCGNNCLCTANEKKPGDTCAGPGGSCTLFCSNAYDCRGEQGCKGANCPVVEQPSCRCCCDPSNKSSDPTAADFDSCKNIGAGKLSCLPNIGNCSGDKRGMCCGCKEDGDCGDSATTGCGKDTCCHPKLSVLAMTPENKAEAICRNTAIKAQFSAVVDKNSLAGNMIVVGDYGAGLCPSGTSLLGTGAQASAGSWLARAWRSLADLFNLLSFNLFKTASAQNDHNYCLVPSQVKGIDSVNDKTNVSTAVISLKNALAANTKYFVIIKGDANLTSQAGVLSDKGVGFVGENLPGIVSFNSIEYPNSQVWSFTTGSDICQVVKIKVDPSQHLFRKAGEAMSFNAQALDKESNELYPVSEYAWSYNWSVQNPAVATVQAGDDDSSAVVKSGNIFDGVSTLAAKAEFTADLISPMSTVGQSVVGQARLIVFLCANPWPPIADVNAWPLQWLDTDSNCSVCTDPATGKARACISGDCASNNFALYYCRDAGQERTDDDLPSLDAQSPVRGRYSYSVNNKWVDVLKEYYWFRSQLPTAPADVKGENSAAALGGEAKISWSASADAVYKIYYGTASGHYNNYVIAKGTPVVIKNLKNGTTYYFAITNVDTRQTESRYSAEVKVAVADQVAPAAVANVVAAVDVRKADNMTIKATWKKETIDIARYVLEYGPNNPPAVSIKVGLKNNYVINRLNNIKTQDYFVRLYAEDAAGNKSAFVNLRCASGCTGLCDCVAN